VNVSLSQVNREHLSGTDVSRCLVSLDNCVVELDDVAEMQPSPGWTKHEKDVALASCIAVRQRHVELLDSRAHDT